MGWSVVILSGRLADWSVADLLQILRITAKTASLRIEGPDGGGILYFDHGLLVGATFDGLRPGRPGRDRLVECVYLLQLLPEGSFDIGADAPPEPVQGVDADEVLERARALLDADLELRRAGLAEGDAVRLSTGLPDPVTVAGADWDVIAALVGEVELGRLEALLGRPEAVAFLNRLRATGLLAPIDGRGELESPGEDIDVPVPEAAPPPRWGEMPAEETYEEVEPAEAGLPELEDAFLSLGPEAPSGPPQIEGVINGLTHQRIREMRSVISPAETTLVPGVLDDLRQRFRPVEERSLD